MCRKYLASRGGVSFGSQVSKQTKMQRTLKFGMVGSDVLAVKDDLHRLGYLGEEDMDGYFGETTENALKEFQENYGLAVTGIVNEETHKALSQRLAAKG